MIRPASLDDMAVIEAIEEQRFSDPAERWNAASLEEHLQSDHCIKLAAIDDSGNMVGFLFGCLLDPDMELLNMAVRTPEGTGFGKRLLCAFRRMYDRDIVLRVRAGNTEAEQFYAKYGFTEEGRTPSHLKPVSIYLRLSKQNLKSSSCCSSLEVD